MGPEHILGKSTPVFHNDKHHEPLCHICSTGSSQGEWFFLQGVFIFSRGVSFGLTFSIQDTVVKYRKGELNHLSEDEIWSAKHLYDSAYHPDTGGSNAKNNSVRLKIKKIKQNKWKVTFEDKDV